MNIEIKTVSKSAVIIDTNDLPNGTYDAIWRDTKITFSINEIQYEGLIESRLMGKCACCELTVLDGTLTLS